MKRPNWKEWEYTPDVTVWQACALSMDIDPHSMVPHRRLIGTSSGAVRLMEKDAVGPSLEPYDFSSPDEKEEFERRQRALRMHLSNRKFFSPGVLNQIQQDNSLVRLSEFASWAVSVVKWEGLPVELVEMASDLPKSGGSPVPEKPTTTTNRGHVSDKLATLNQAAAHFWANADREDRGTHPKNADVAAWLEKRGYSQGLAAKAASIIRPEWAPTGRKPEE